MASRDFKTEEDVYRELGRELGRAPNQIVWGLLVMDRLPSNVIDPWPDDGETGSADDAEAAFAELVDKYRRTERYMSESGSLNGQRRAVPPPRSSPPTFALDALSEIMAIEAQSHPLVVAFRERVLGGTYLTPSDAAAWMRDHDGHLWLGEPWPPAWAHPLIHAARIERYATVSDFAVPENEVDFMVCVIDMLRTTYGWRDPVEVAGFVLSGETPSLPLAVAHVQPYGRFFPKTVKVCLEVSPQMEPLQLMKLYASMRHAGMPPNSRIRPPRDPEKASRLAVFAAGHNDGSSWQDVWAAWNAEHDQQYADVRSFSRDARKAYHMVTGEDLEWRTGKDNGPSRESGQDTSSKRKEQP